jgi:hypothetical protein
MYAVFVIVFEPMAFAATSITVYVPAIVYWCDGLLAVLVPPSPNVHAHDVGEPADVSANCTVNGIVPEVGVPVKSATGATGTAPRVI